uniref:Membrane protein, putative n=1 Tax=Babesia bovis TaxID=5865 RepID=S6BNY4_BABBO|nr:membrane protein, putative [Babesia bovis]
MDTTTCATIVLVLLWLSTCCQALGSLVILIPELDNIPAVSTTTTLSTILIGVCLWQCKKAGYLVSPMTWYHWMLLALLVILQIMAVEIEYLGLQGMLTASIGKQWAYPIYGVPVALLVLLGSTLYCGWKCNLFCRPCCKSQYICYGSAIVVILVVLVVLVVTGALAPLIGDGLSYGDINHGAKETMTICYLGKMVLPCIQCYAMAMIWNTTLKLPYAVPEVVALTSSALAVASILAVAFLGGKNGVLLSTLTYPLLAFHLVALGITWYCLEYKEIFQWPKQYLCFGVLAVVLVVVLLLAIMYINKRTGETSESVEYTLLGYSLLLMIPTLWYAYRCGLLTWRWNSCVPKKKGLKATETAENTTAGTDIAKE